MEKPKRKRQMPAGSAGSRSAGRYVRRRSDDLYHTSRWTRESRAFRLEHPLCEECRRKGIVRASEVTDHIIPYPLCDFWDRSNWQALCGRCNHAKGQRDKRLLQLSREQGGG